MEGPVSAKTQMQSYVIGDNVMKKILVQYRCSFSVDWKVPKSAWFRRSETKDGFRWWDWASQKEAFNLFLEDETFWIDEEGLALFPGKRNEQESAL